jgi:hypothetical protein
MARETLCRVRLIATANGQCSVMIEDADDPSRLVWANDVGPFRRAWSYLRTHRAAAIELTLGGAGMTRALRGRAFAGFLGLFRMVTEPDHGARPPAVTVLGAPGAPVTAWFDPGAYRLVGHVAAPPAKRKRK